LLKLPSCTLFYESLGAAQPSDTVLFAHSWGLDHHHVLALAEKLLARQPQYRIVACDYRGVGESSKMSADYVLPHGLDDVVEDFHQLVQALELQRDGVHFVGVSIGGSVGLRYALKYPAEVRSLTLICSKADAFAPVPREMIGGLMKAMTVDPKPLVEVIIEKVFFSKRTIAKRADVVDTYRRFWSNTPASEFASAFPLANAFLHMEDLTAKLPLIRCPCLVIVGAEDEVYRPASAHMSQHLTGSSNRLFVIIEGAKHEPCSECPEDMARLLDDFYRPALQTKVVVLA